jgi:pilus assembly protein CpaB
MKLARVAVLGIAVGAGLVAALIAMNLSAPAPVVVTEVVDGTPVPVEAPTEQVLVAVRDIPVGAKITTDSVTWQDWPKSGITERFISATEGEGKDQVEPLVGAIARATIFQGEPITNAKLIQSDRGFMSAMLPTGMRAVAVRIAADTSAGGFILPNDHVDVIMTRPSPDPATSGGSAYLTETILNNVRVLAIDQTIENVDTASGDNTSSTGQTVVGQTATLELTPRQAQIITVAQQMSDRLALALRSIADGRSDPADAAADALHLIGGTKRNGAVTVVKNGVVHDVSGIR